VTGNEGPSGEIKVNVVNLNVSAKSGSCGVGSCDAESELHGTAPLSSCFLSDVVKSD